MNVSRYVFNLIQKNLRIRAYSKLPPEAVVFIDDMIVCWHPEQSFPYEYTKPLPKVVPKPESVLKIGEETVKSVFHKKLPAGSGLPEIELGKMTYTCKHAWFPKARDKKKDKLVPARPYL